MALESTQRVKSSGLFFFNLQYCIGSAIYRNESTTGVLPHPESSSLLPPHTIPLGLLIRVEEIYQLKHFKKRNFYAFLLRS